MSLLDNSNHHTFPALLIEDEYRISAIDTRRYYSPLAFLVRVLCKGGSYLRFSKYRRVLFFFAIFRCGYNSRAGSIQGRVLIALILYM